MSGKWLLLLFYPMCFVICVNVFLTLLYTPPPAGRFWKKRVPEHFSKGPVAVPWWLPRSLVLPRLCTLSELENFYWVTLPTTSTLHKRKKKIHIPVFLPPPTFHETVMSPAVYHHDFSETFSKMLKKNQNMLFHFKAALLKRHCEGFSHLHKFHTHL